MYESIQFFILDILYIYDVGALYRANRPFCTQADANMLKATCKDHCDRTDAIGGTY